MTQSETPKRIWFQPDYEDPVLTEPPKPYEPANYALYVSAGAVLALLKRWAEAGWLDSDAACLLGRDVRDVIDGHPPRVGFGPNDNWPA